MNIRKNDKVIVITGNNKGKEGEVIEINSEKNLVKVKGINIATHYVKARRQGDVSGIQKREAFINVSNVMPIDPKTGTPVRKNKLQREG